MNNSFHRGWWKQNLSWVGVSRTNILNIDKNTLEIL